MSLSKYSQECWLNTITGVSSTCLLNCLSTAKGTGFLSHKVINKHVFRSDRNVNLVLVAFVNFLETALALPGVKPIIVGDIALPATI